MKRLKLKRGLLERLKKRGTADPDLFVKYSAKGKRFKKLHDRAREMIKLLFEGTDRPLQLIDIQTKLMIGCKLKVSRPYLG